MGNWSQWLQQFKIIEKPDEYGSAETMIAAQIAEIEQANSIRFPEGYKRFCETFGSCAFDYSGHRMYCPSFLLSEVRLDSLRIELSRLERSRNNAGFGFRPWGEIDDSVKISNLKQLINKTGFVFGDDSTAAIFIFDTSSYSEADQSCDIWLGAGDGELNRFEYLGRSFYDFFLRFCLNTEDDYVPSASEYKIFVGQDRKELLRFDSQVFHKHWLS